ncbi:MAG: ATP-dependent sacrificial sulfur transferase LarE [bacterium]
MDENISAKFNAIQGILKGIESTVVLLSGGVDSSLVLKIAREVLGESVLAVTVDSPFIPRQEIEQAKIMAQVIGVHHLIVSFDPLQDPELATNPVERCYVCKKRIFSFARGIAAQKGLAWVVDGTNDQDSRLPRPGLRAAEELAIRSPLREAGLQKDEVRALAQELGLPNWNKPSNSCLATRFPVRELLTRGKLSLIEQGERFLQELGLSCFRLRYHGQYYGQHHGQNQTQNNDQHHSQLARIHASGHDWKIILDNGLGPKIIHGLRELGFETVTLDLEEYCP